MAKEYHPDTPQTIPHAALIHSERELNPDNSSYPSYFQRDDWVTAKIAEHRLSLPEGAVLRRVSHYAGTAAGCWAGIDRIAAELGCHEKTVRRAIEVLLREGLVTQGGWRSRVRILILTLDIELSARSDIPDSGQRVRLTSLTDKEQTERERIYSLSSSQKERPGPEQKRDAVLSTLHLSRKTNLPSKTFWMS